MIPTWLIVLLVVLAGCTTARRAPWIIEQPLSKEAAPPVKQTLEISP